MKKFIVLFLLVFILSGCAVTFEYKEITATVIDKNQTAMWMQPIISGKITTYIVHPAEFRITIGYENYHSTYNRESLYYSYNVGDKIPAYLQYGYDRDGKLVWTDIVLEKR